MRTTIVGRVEPAALDQAVCEDVASGTSQPKRALAAGEASSAESVNQLIAGLGDDGEQTNRRSWRTWSTVPAGTVGGHFARRSICNLWLRMLSLQHETGGCASKGGCHDTAQGHGEASAGRAGRDARTRRRILGGRARADEGDGHGRCDQARLVRVLPRSLGVDDGGDDAAGRSSGSLETRSGQRRGVRAVPLFVGAVSRTDGTVVGVAVFELYRPHWFARRQERS